MMPSRCIILSKFWRSSIPRRPEPVQLGLLPRGPVAGGRGGPRAHRDDGALRRDGLGRRLRGPARRPFGTPSRASAEYPLGGSATGISTRQPRRRTPLRNIHAAAAAGPRLVDDRAGANASLARKARRLCANGRTKVRGGPGSQSLLAHYCDVVANKPRKVFASHEFKFVPYGCQTNFNGGACRNVTEGVRAVHLTAKCSCPCSSRVWNRTCWPWLCHGLPDDAAGIPAPQNRSKTDFVSPDFVSPSSVPPAGAAAESARVRTSVGAGARPTKRPSRRCA